MASTKKRKSTNSKKSTKNTKENKQNFMRAEITILVSLAVCIFAMISHFGIGGFIGDALSAFLFGVFGFMAYIVPILVFIGITFVLSNKGNKQAYFKAGSCLAVFLMCCTLFQLIINGYDPSTTLKDIYSLSSIHKDGGGWLGGVLVNLLCPAVGTVGTYIVVSVLFIISFVLLTGKSFVGMVKTEGEKVYQTAKEDAKRRRELNERQRAEKQEEKEHEVKRVDKVISGVSFNTTLDKNTPTVDDMHEIEPPAGSKETLFAPEEPTELVIDRATPVAEEKDFVEPEKEEPTTRKRRSTIESRESAATEAENVEKERKAYKFPPMNLLTRGKASGGDSDTYLRETARKLEQTLQTFHVNATVTNVSCGPAVTRFELQPEMGGEI